jgi:hypothetical protein
VIDSAIAPVPAVNAIVPPSPTRPPIWSVPGEVIVNVGVAVVVEKASDPAAENVSAGEPVSSAWPDRAVVPELDAPADVSVIVPEAPDSWIAAGPAPALVRMMSPAAIVVVIGPLTETDRVVAPTGAEAVVVNTIAGEFVSPWIWKVLPAGIACVSAFTVSDVTEPVPEAAEVDCSAAIPVDAPVAAIVSDDAPAVIAKVPWIEATVGPSDSVAGPETELHAPVVPPG